VFTLVNCVYLWLQQEALGQGLQQVLWLYGEDHLITEVGTMNIFMFCINDNGGNVFPKDDIICWNVSFLWRFTLNSGKNTSLFDI
jgi:hypothetical protein